MKPPSWSAFRARAKRRPGADAYEPLQTDTWYSVEVFAPPSLPKALLFFTRRFLCKVWLEQDRYPKHLLSMVRGGVLTLGYWRWIRDAAKQARLPLCFVGDLDPYDLTTFLVLRSGDPDLRRPGRQALPITFAGIDDSWLELCEGHLLPRMRGELPVIKMAGLELEHRDIVLHLAPWLLDLVGPRCADLLRSGMKLEVEGASNPSFYDEGFHPALRAHLLQRAGSN